MDGRDDKRDFCCLVRGNALLSYGKRMSRGSGNQDMDK